MISRRVLLAIGAAACISYSLAAATGSEHTQSPSTGHANIDNVHATHKLVKAVVLGKHEGEDITAYFYRVKGSSETLAKRSVQPDLSVCESHDGLPRPATSNLTLVDMSPDPTTPPQCTSVNCYPGAFEAPDRVDCNVIAERQLSQYLEKSKLLACPGSFNYVVYRSCGVVFQHLNSNSNYALEYKWSFLGNMILLLERQCFRPQAMSIGGACRFSEYKKYKFQNVLISLQRVFRAPPTGPAPQ